MVGGHGPGYRFGPAQGAHWPWKKYTGPLQTRCLGNKSKCHTGKPLYTETPYREATVFRSHDPKYYTTSNWLGPGNGFETT